jgi:hypothetical protein
MVYIGEGYTNIPCFSLLKKNAGTPLVFTILKPRKMGARMEIHRRWTGFNFSTGGLWSEVSLAGSLLMATEAIAKRIKFSGTSYQG